MQEQMIISQNQFSVDELLARIRVTQRRLALIQSGEEQEQAVFVNGELKIDYYSRIYIFKR